MNPRGPAELRYLVEIYKSRVKPHRNKTERSEVELSVSREAASQSDDASKSGLFGGVETLTLLKNK
jgi:hypothetical protein